MTRLLPPPRAVWALALLIATCAPLHAQLAAGVLRLTVTDSTGLALPASGTLSSVSAQTTREFEIGANGRFTFDRLLPGVYRLTVSRPGFATRTELVEIQSELPREIQIVLEVAPLSASVVVTEEATLVDRRRPGVVYAVGAQQLREQQSAVPGRELLDLVNLQPGWLVEANGVLHPRGSEYQTLFVVDGVPMDDNRSPAYAPVLPDPEVETVNVLTGTFPAEYGRKLGGVVDVTTRRDIRRGFHGSVESGFGSFRSSAAFASGGYGWTHRLLTASAGASRTDRYLDPPTVANDSNHGSLGDAAIAFEQEPSGADRIRLALRTARSAFHVPNDLVQHEAGQRQDRSSRETSASAAWSRIFSSTLVNMRAVGTDLSARLSSNAASVPIAVFQQRGFSRGYFSANVAAQAGSHEFKVGGDVLYAAPHEALQYQITDRSFFDQSTPITFAFSDRKSDREQALFAQDTMRLANLTLSVGLRWDRYAFLVDDRAFSPRLGAAWSPSSNLVVRFSYDRAFLTPATENLLLASSPEVDSLSRQALRLPVPPSRGNYLEGGVSAAVARTARLDASVYRRTFTNFADDDVFLNTGISFPIAFHAADIHGVDLKLTLPEWHGLSGFAGYSNLAGRAELPLVGGLFVNPDAVAELDATEHVPITQDQRHTVRARVRYQIGSPGWVAGLAKYGSGLPVELADNVAIGDLVEHHGAEVVERVNFDIGRMRPNFSVDAALGIALWRRDKRRLDLRGEVDNLTDRLNVINFSGLFSGTAVAPARSGSLRLRYEF